MTRDALTLSFDSLAGRLRSLRADQRRFQELALIVLIIGGTAFASLSIPSSYPRFFAVLLSTVVALFMIQNQEKTLYLMLWFSTVYLTLKATVLGWSDIAILFKDGFLLLLFAFWFFHFLLRDGKLKKTPLNQPLMMLVFWLILQCFNPNTYGFMSILQDLRFWLIPLMVYLLTVQLVDTREKVERAMKIVFTYAVIETVYGVMQQFMPGDLLVTLGANPNSYGYFYGGTIRSHSTMGTNGFALFASMFPTISFFYASQQKNELRRAFFFVVGFLFVGGVVLTLVRTGWVAVTLSLVCYSVIARRWKILAVMALVIAFVMMTSSGYMRWKIDGMLTPSQDASVTTRLEIFKIVSEGMVFRVFGYGLGTFAHNRYGMGMEDKIGYGTATENWYLMTSLELGWIGVFLLLWIWYKIYRFALRGYFGALKTDRYRELALAIAGSLFAIEIARLGGPSGYYPPDSWHYWFFVGILMSLPKADEELAAIEEAEGQKLEPESIALGT